MPRSNVYCDYCRKNIGSDKLAWFSDAEKNLDFCSETCHLKWDSEINWKDIHKDFGKKSSYSSNETYQQKWEQVNITKEEAKEWIELGFEPNDYWTVKEWKNFNFSPTEIKVWLEVGLNKYWDLEFASWLRTNNHTPKLVKNNLEQLGTDYENLKINNSQAWLEQVYPNHNIKELGISKKNLKGELNLSQYQQLERLDCSDNKLTNITLPTSLKYLDLSDNNFSEQDLSFLVPCANLEKLDLRNYDKNKIKQGIYNKFTGSLDYLSSMEQLKELDISHTDINEVNIDKLSRSLKKIEYSTYYRLDCKLTAIVPLLEPVKYAFCQKCYQVNTSENWCQPCAEQEWKGLEGQELINKFIEQQGKDLYGKDKLKWIPYEEFTYIEHLADGGFSKIYKARWEKNYCNAVLKSLNNSQNITWEFLTEITNTKLVEDGRFVVKCHGISQDPTTKNYLMVMKYIESGNLRQYLQNKYSKMSWEDKISKLGDIVLGLNSIHDQNLVHQDFHSGNILNSSGSSGSRRNIYTYITDLGLSRPVNHQKQTGQIFGVLPYVAPEVLKGQPYTQKADIYSFGIIMYELLTNSYPYLEMDNTELALKVCNGYRPNLDKVPLPQLLKDLIKRCWDSNPNKRPNAEELKKIIGNWWREIRDKKHTPFYQQYQEIEVEYNTFSRNTPYQIHSNAITTSKMIDTKTITQQLEKLKTMEWNPNYFDKGLEYSKSLVMDFGGLNLESNSNWTIIHPSFTEELIQKWKEHNFTFEQCRDWINVGLKPNDYNFCAWLRNNKNYTSEQVLNHSNLEQLNQEYFQWWQEQQAQIEQFPK